MQESFFSSVLLNYRNIIAHVERLVEGLLRRQREDHTDEAPIIRSIGDVILEAALEWGDDYVYYAVNLPFAKERLKQERKANPAFDQFVSVCIFFLPTSPNSSLFEVISRYSPVGQTPESSSLILSILGQPIGCYGIPSSCEKSSSTLPTTMRTGRPLRPRWRFLHDRARRPMLASPTPTCVSSAGDTTLTWSSINTGPHTYVVFSLICHSYFLATGI
jgi:hypothetical protein